MYIIVISHKIIDEVLKNYITRHTQYRERVCRIFCVLCVNEYLYKVPKDIIDHVDCFFFQVY